MDPCCGPVDGVLSAVGFPACVRMHFEARGLGSVRVLRLLDYYRVLDGGRGGGVLSPVLPGLSLDAAFTWALIRGLDMSICGKGGQVARLC